MWCFPDGFASGRIHFDQVQGQQDVLNKKARRIKILYLENPIVIINVVDPNPDPPGSALIWLLGSGSAFLIRIRIQEHVF
jgi:hypothetical protein